MPQYRTPGVYVEERDTGAVPIEGVGTSTAGFLGIADRGPVEPRRLTNFGEYRRLYGDFTESKHLAYAVDGFFTNGGGSCYVGRVTKKEAVDARGKVVLSAEGRDENDGPKGTKVMTVTALGPGAYSKQIAVVRGLPSLPKEGDQDLFSLTIQYWSELKPAKNLEDEEGELPDDSSPEQLYAGQGDPDQEEVYDNLSPIESSTNYFEKRINNASSLVEVEKSDNAGTAIPHIGTDDDGKPTEYVWFLSSGVSNDGNGSGPAAADFAGVEKLGERTGLAAFAEIDEIAIVCAPDEVDVEDVTGEVITHCESLKDRVAIIQPEQARKPTDLPAETHTSDRGYATLYYPWLKIRDPVTDTDKLIPPGGHVAGVWARVDSTRGVHKAPANETLRGITGLEFAINDDQQATLNPKGVNCIRTFRGRGTRVWGARTLASNQLWKYLNVRRLFNYLEESMQEGTQWAVFEPNDPALWARFSQSLSNFLNGAWRDGALVGNTAEEAYYVTCDRTTMTQEDIDNGILIAEVGVAPVKPAEFVVIRISQKTGGPE